jgi:CheY-specific phosphatase CheX
MEREALAKAMKRSISEVLEKMFFLPVDFSDATRKEGLWKPESGHILVTRLNFKGPFSGCLYFFIPEALTRSLAASFLGEDEGSVNNAHVTETVKEIANMIAGNAFSLFDDQKIFDLGIPEMVEMGAVQESHSGPEGIFIAINTIDNCLAVQLDFSS